MRQRLVRALAVVQKAPDNGHRLVTRIVRSLEAANLEADGKRAKQNGEECHREDDAPVERFVPKAQAMVNHAGERRTECES